MSESRAAFRNIHYIPTTEAEPECGDRAGSVTTNPANVGCRVCLGNLQAARDAAHAEAIKEYRAREFAAMDAEVDALRAEFRNRPWDAARRLEIRTRLAQLSHTVYPDRHETQDEYEIDRLRARHMATDLPEEKERIVGKLAALGAVVYPEGSPEYTAYRATLAKALADPRAWNFLDE